MGVRRVKPAVDQQLFLALFGYDRDGLEVFRRWRVVASAMPLQMAWRFQMRRRSSLCCSPTTPTPSTMARARLDSAGCVLLSETRASARRPARNAPSGCRSRRRSRCPKSSMRTAFDRAAGADRRRHETLVRKRDHRFVGVDADERPIRIARRAAGFPRRHLRRRPRILAGPGGSSSRSAASTMAKIARRPGMNCSAVAA